MLAAIALTCGAVGCGADVVASTGVASEEARRAPLEEAADAAEVPAAVCAAEARAVQTAAEAFRVDEGAYPTTIDDLVGTYLQQKPAYHELRAASATELEVVPIAGRGCG